MLVHAHVTRVLQAGTLHGKRDFRRVEYVISGTTGTFLLRYLTWRRALADNYVGPRRLFIARKEVILSAGPVGSPFILLHSGIGDSKDLSHVGIKPLIHLPSVGRNLSDHPVAPVLWPVNTTDTIETVVRDPIAAAKALEEWKESRTGVLVDIVFNQLGWSRVQNGGEMFKKYGDPSAGQNSAHFELAFQV